MRKAIAIALLAIASLAAFASRGNGGAVRGAAARAWMMAAQMVEVEYLETSGTQYIDTGVTPDMTTNVRGSYSLLYGKNVYLYGSRIAFGNKMYAIQYNNGQMYINYCNKQSAISTTVPDDGIYTVSQTGAKVVTSWGVNTTVTYGDDCLNNLNIQLMAMRNSSQVWSPGIFRCHSFTIIKGGATVRDFIPVRVGSVGYMYDRVSGKLFGNSGTGAFIVGPDKQ